MTLLIAKGQNFWNLENKWFSAGLATVTLIGGACLYRRYSRFRRPLQKNQLVVFTGCDSGLGYSLAIHCQKRGARVIAGVLQENGPGARDLLKKGVRVLSLDVTNRSSVEVFSLEVQKMLDINRDLKLRALVNNAGVMIFGEFEWQLEDQHRYQLEVNVLGTMSVTKSLLPLARQHSSRIVNVTSHCALASLPGLSVYGASKAGLMAWTDSLRVELKKYGVDVVAFIPGSFVLESNLLGRQREHFEEMRARMDEETRRFYGEYFDRYVEYLASLPTINDPLRPPRPLDNDRLYESFDGALLDQSPRAVYKCEPWRYTLYHFLFRVTPTNLRDWLVEKFVNMPSWKKD